MDGCFVVDENYEPVAVVDERVVHLYAGLFSHGNQVITVTAPPQRQEQLHPLELEVQRSRETKRANQCSRLTTNSVIQALPEAPQFNPTSVVGNLSSIQSNVSISPFVTNSVLVTEKHDLEATPEKVLWLSSNANSNTSTFEETTTCPKQRDDLSDLESAPIPLTVPNCREAVSSIAEGNTEDSASDEEPMSTAPVMDDEPDPDLPAPSSPDAMTDMSNRCYMCFKKFSRKKNMYAHIRKIHSSQPKFVGGITCPLCKMNTLRQEHLRNHLFTLHEIKIEYEERHFDSMQDFLTWKEAMEKETISYFITKSATKILALNETKAYYKCHRSGYNVTEKKEDKNKKKLKSQFSYKIGATCPAAMEVIENSSGVSVVFWSTHVGHNQEAKYITPIVGERTDLVESNSEPTVSVETEGSAHVKCEVSETIKSVKNEDRPIPWTEDSRVALGKKVKKVSSLRSATQATIIEKAETLINLLKTTEVLPEFRPQVCLMIDNLIAAVSRRTEVQKTADKRQRNRHIKYHFGEDSDNGPSATNEGELGEDISSQYSSLLKRSRKSDSSIIR